MLRRHYVIKIMSARTVRHNKNPSSANHIAHTICLGIVESLCLLFYLLQNYGEFSNMFCSSASPYCVLALD
jgi:hypothetical protein